MNLSESRHAILRFLCLQKMVLLHFSTNKNVFKKKRLTIWHFKCFPARFSFYIFSILCTSTVKNIKANDDIIWWRFIYDNLWSCCSLEIYGQRNVNYQIYWNGVKYYCHNDINNDFMLEHFAALHKKSFSSWNHLCKT